MTTIGTSVEAILDTARTQPWWRIRSVEEPAARRQSARRTLLACSYVLASATLAGAVGLLSLSGAIWLRLATPPWSAELAAYRPVALFAVGARAVLYFAHRHHRNRSCRGYADELAHAVREATVGSLALVVFTFFWRGGGQYRTFSYSRSVFIGDWVLAILGLSVLLVVNKSVLSAVRRRGHNRRTIAIVGDSPAARQFVDTIDRNPEMGYAISAHLPPPAPGRGDFVTELANLARQGRLDAVFLGDRAIGRDEISRLVGLSQFRRLDVHAVPELFGLPPTKVSLGTLGPFPVLSLLQDPIRGTRRVIKRTLDVVGAAAALLLLSPLMVVAALAVRFTSRGPVLFRQERLGMDGRRFSMLKFRTMRKGAGIAPHADFVVALVRGTGAGGSQGGSLHKLCADPRVTPVGRILRRLSIDELPQLINVLKGDMSLVGPRPSLPYEAAVYDDWHRGRLDVRPGMTGLWQVSGRSKLTYDEMVKLDLTYIETWAPMRDLVILLRTVPAVLRRESG